jgi:hypothetical protein
MKTLILLASAALLVSTGPAYAKPNHSKHANQGHQAHGLQAHGYGGGACPKGLAKKNAECMPPGLHKKLFSVGQRMPHGYSRYTPYSQIPYDLRRQYGLSRDDRYIYRDNYIYRVDPKTMIVRQILGAIL